jgi:hypothetical protein
MEYLDGEGTASSRAAIGAHLATCAACQAFAAEQKGLSRELGAWQVAPAPDTLRPPAPSPAPARWSITAWLRQPRAAVLALSGVGAALVMFAVATSTFKRAVALPSEEALDRNAGHALAMPSGDSFRFQPAKPSTAGSGGGRPAAESRIGTVDGAVRAQKTESQTTPQSTTPVRALIRTATLQIVAKDFGGVRAAVERSVAEANGFADQMALSADPGSARVLRATLRVPGDQLSAALDRLRALGQVTADQQGAEDVSDQLVDLDARLKNARATEQRLTDILRERTGKLSDVLEVEQEVARVRLEIEQLDAQKTNMSRRVAYAAIDLTISEERKAGLESGPLPLLTQARIAAADGVQNVVDTVVGVVLFVLRAGPTLILWLAAAGSAWFVVRRRRTPRRV